MVFHKDFYVTKFKDYFLFLSNRTTSENWDWVVFCREGKLTRPFTVQGYINLPAVGP